MVISEKFPRNKLYVDLIGPCMRRKNRHKINILLKPFTPNSPAQKVYITQHKAMPIAKVLEIFGTTEYNLS